MKKPSFARLWSAQPFGISGVMVSVEVDVVAGLNRFSIVGVPDKAVEESRDRVGTALHNSGMQSPKHTNEKTVVSLAPAELRKEGSYFDLAIAIGYLIAVGVIGGDMSSRVVLGELSLNGDVQPLHGVLPLVVAARDAGMAEIYVPMANTAEASLVPGISVYGVAHLRDLVSHIDPDGYRRVIEDDTRGGHTMPEPVMLTPVDHDPSVFEVVPNYPDIATIRGQESAKRALEIAAAGCHSIALYGPPGTGKTMLARAFTGLLPALSPDEAIEVTGIHSVVGALEGAVVTHPPFRSPHHTASYVALVGGGAVPRPGEVTLAHRGVLFLDEFPEFDGRVLESLRQPLEDKVVTVSRARGTMQFPANFLLVAAMNPCPCGYRGVRATNASAGGKQCTCNQMQLQKYRKKLSGPLVDRIDLWVPVEHITYETLHSQVQDGEGSDIYRERIRNARAAAQARAQTSHISYPNNLIKPAQMQSIGLSDPAKELLMQSAEKLHLSPRAYHRVLRVARTIADLASSTTIEVPHILEALQYRPKAPITD